MWQSPASLAVPFILAALLFQAACAGSSDSTDQQPEPPTALEPGVTEVSASEWTPLFNGRDLSGWSPWLQGSSRGEDSRSIFRVGAAGSPDTEGALHVLGLPAGEEPPFGYLVSNAKYQHYRLRLEQRWGERTFAPREGLPKDSGLLYHVSGPDQIWPQSAEFQIQVGDTGDLWLLSGVRAESRVDRSGGEPRYADKGRALTLENGAVRKSERRDLDAGWNSLELIVDGPEATHIVNGAVVNRAWGFEKSVGDAWQSLVAGHIAIQAEGAELFYRNIQIRGLPYTPPPEGSIVLFDGTSLNAWQMMKGGGPASWTVANGALEVCPDICGDIQTKQAFGDVRLHLEFRVPPTPGQPAEQDRGNSGVYLQGRYEVQILDSSGYPLEGADDAGAIYGVRDASSNEAMPPLTWQAFDVVFRAPRWQGNTKVENARMTVHWNGKEVHQDVEVPAPTRLGNPEGPEPAGIRLQDHWNAVQFRNIWIQPL